MRGLFEAAGRSLETDRTDSTPVVLCTGMQITFRMMTELLVLAVAL
jgi:hypothetical protein